MSANPNVQETTAIIAAWVKIGRDLDRQLDALVALTGCQCESPLYESIMGVWDAHTAMVSRFIGDTGDWLFWYRYDNDNGAKAGIVETIGKARKIRNPRDLARLIVELRG